MVDMGITTTTTARRRRRRDDGAIGFRERTIRCVGKMNRFLAMVAALLVISEASHVCSAQSLNEAKAYLDNVESEVMRLAAKASENFANTCGTLNSSPRLSNLPHHLFSLRNLTPGRRKKTHTSSHDCFRRALNLGIVFGTNTCNVFTESNDTIIIFITSSIIMLSTIWSYQSGHFETLKPWKSPSRVLRFRLHFRCVIELQNWPIHSVIH